MSKEKEQVEVNEVSTPEPTAFATHGLLPEEVEMAKKHGLVEEETKEIEEKSKKEDKDGEHKEPTSVETEEDTGDEEAKDEEAKGGETDEVKPAFEDVEKNEDGLKKYNPNEQALYWKWKSDKKKRQEAQKEAEEIKAKYELNQVKDSAYKVKLKKISEALRSDNLTVEALQSIIGEETSESEDRPITKSDLERIEAEKTEKQKSEERVNQQRSERIKLAEEIGKTKYKNFDELTELANKVVESDKTNTYRDVLQAAFADEEVDEDSLVERVVTIAKLHPEYGKKKSPESEKTDVDRAIKNSKKKISSAAVGSGGGKRTISYDELTVEDAARLSTDQWMKLPDEVRKRLLMQ